MNFIVFYTWTLCGFFFGPKMSHSFNAYTHLLSIQQGQLSLVKVIHAMKSIDKVSYHLWTIW
jgi:hypothetical protein